MTHLPAPALKARVFISCGQKSHSDEVTIAGNLATELEALGFETYVAIKEQSLKALRENIFTRLTDSEYFLFIDFKREILSGGSEHRGSLFSHQELAIASYLNKPIIAFREDSVKERDGLIGHLQVNCFKFSSRVNLVGAVLNEVSKAAWEPAWRSELTLSVIPKLSHGCLRMPENKVAHYCHLFVQNNHATKAARDCMAYLKSVVNLSTGKLVKFESVELKWAGYLYPFATIAPASSRRLDAFYFFADQPDQLHFNCFTDSSEYIPTVKGAGTWKLTYEVSSETVPGCTGSIMVTTANSLADVSIKGA